MSKVFFIKDELNAHFVNHSKQYYISIFVTILAIVIGLILSFSDYSYLSILNAKENMLFDYILGSINKVEIFYEKLKNVFLSLVVVFALNISVYSSFLAYIYVGYQFVLLILSTVSIISLYSFFGVLIVIFLILPINLIYYLILNSYNCILSKRASIANSLKLGFIDSFKENKTYVYIFIVIIMFLILCIIYSFILPLFVKSFWFILY